MDIMNHWTENKVTITGQRRTLRVALQAGVLFICLNNFGWTVLQFSCAYSYALRIQVAILKLLHPIIATELLYMYTRVVCLILTFSVQIKYIQEGVFTMECT